MFKKYDAPVIGYPYHTASGLYRCFDGVKWHDCDKNGKWRHNNGC